ncbi:NAD(P)-binding protein [Dothidotthia symphoricarpi CBS 119687]|uniref:NAD(P)-binding protein n=1 Tax=Dothidotthia symphoricarpi CBS 119687 TaxID=1392245 RepID=A0A6A6A5T1_9PLEO|nr:NAD(P)-binding protein [Dothidotthia symphoricarpi CBS 119687]KAF2127342.1 NAD(P)-binding protein [Dothidotthia symphoricarpi CBS 119687]
MPFAVLSDTDVKAVLRDLKPFEVTNIADDLVQAFVQYSCHDEQQYQPHRNVITRPGNQVSLFMPATTQQSIGVKIVGISPSQDPAGASQDAKLKPALQSALTICDALGQATGILNAAELTAFRTALGSILLYRLRQVTENIVVFGAGKQALWHIRLAILLRGQDIRKITVINRSSRRTQELFDAITESGLPLHIDLEAFGEKEDDKVTLEDVVTAADAIFCTTPSTTPLFPATFMTSEKARVKTRFISAIGSYRLDMAEIDPELLKAVTDPSGSFSHQVWQGHIAVDSIEGCLQEAGELVTAGLSSDQMLEIGRMEDLRAKTNPSGLREWLESGFVIYKSVGIGIMDIAVGNKLVELARSKDIGIHLDSF